MNLLEHYIIEIKNIETKKYGNNEYYVVTMIVDCYGRVEEATHMFTLSEWERAKKEGFYLA